MKDTEVLDKEQAVLDEYENNVDNLIERLEDLVVTTKPVRPHTSTDYLEIASALMTNQCLFLLPFLVSMRVTNVHTTPVRA